jgi:DNA-binding response OmpR family regulator
VDGSFQVVVLDLGLPDIDGRDALRMIRAVSAVPVIVATARDDEAAIVRILDHGADDYMVKPFGPAQLDARIRAVLRRTGGDGGRAAPLVVGQLWLDLAAREATFAGTSLDLTAREFDLLSYLANRAGTVVSKRELLTQNLARAVRRRGEDHRRAHVLATPQGGRVRNRTALPAHHPRRRDQLAAPPTCRRASSYWSRRAPRWCWSRSSPRWLS